MAKVEAPTKDANITVQLISIAPDSLKQAAKKQSEIGLTTIGDFTFNSPRGYFLMERDNLLRVNLDDDHSLFVTSNYLYDSSARIFGHTFDPHSWRKTMLKTQGDLETDKPVMLARSPYARSFLRLARIAATDIFIDGYDPAMEYIAARSYFIAQNTKNETNKKDKKNYISSGNMRLELSLLNSLDYSRSHTSRVLLATENEKRLRKKRLRARTKEERINHEMEERLQIFAESNNLQAMLPMLDGLAQDIVDSVSQHDQFSKPDIKRLIKSGRQNSLIELETPSNQLLDRLTRRETIIQRPNERVGAYGKEWDHTQPVEIANSAMFVETPQGKGWMPFESSHTLDPNSLQFDDYRRKLAKIKEVYIVQHGVMRNAKDYQRYFMDALGKHYDPETMLVISPQFLAPVDLKEPKKLWDKEHGKMWGKKIDPDTILRWRYNDWKGAEPAMNPDAPVDSFTAMDSLIEWILQFTPNAHTMEMRGNSEGGQFMDRYLAFSKGLNILQYSRRQPLKINGILSNPGSILHFNTSRPVFNKKGAIIRWREYAFDSRENTWPFGMYDLTPYVRESLNEWPNILFNHSINKHMYKDPLEFALWNYLNRTTLAIGRDDDVIGGFHLPKGPGPAYYAQGNTRYRRMKGKFESLIHIVNRKPREYYPQPRMITIGNVEHNAWDVFNAIELYQRTLKDIERYGGSIDLVH
jgi:hypothetical protein